jgi:hypothetical protein
MATYNASSTEQFTMSSTINNVNDGFEIYFLDAGFTAEPPASIPEPGTVLLLGSGLIALVAYRRKFRKS